MVFTTKRIVGVLAIALTSLACTETPRLTAQAAAQGTPQAPAPAQSEPPVDEFARTTPLSTVQGLLGAGRRGDYQRAARYLQTPLRGDDAALLARQLFIVIDRRMPARLNAINNTPEGALSDSLPLNQDLVGTINGANGKVDVLVERVDRGASGSVWLFSSETLAAIPDLYEEISSTSPEQWLPRFLVTSRIEGLPLFGWLLIVVGTPLFYVVSAWPLRLVGRLAARWRPRRLREAPGSLATAEKPIRLLIIAFVIGWLASAFGFSLRVRQFWADAAATIGIVATIWLLFVLNARIEEYVRWRLMDRNLAGLASVLRLARRALDGVLVLAGLFVFFHYFGVNPTAAIAGLGVGGIAVALAAQKTLENVIAGISLTLDQAVRVGDFLKAGDSVGTVDAIGLRSTRIRTLDRTVVSVPNGQIANISLETMSARDKFWFHPLIRLSCETTVAQIRRVVEDVRALLEKHPEVDQDGLRVRFLSFGTASLDVEVHAYVTAADWNAFLETQEALLFQIMEIVQQAGARIAIPSQVLYMAGPPSAVN